MTQFPLPQCFSCKKLKSEDETVCSAYPDGIPVTIIRSIEKCKYYDPKEDI